MKQITANLLIPIALITSHTADCRADTQAFHPEPVDAQYLKAQQIKVPAPPTSAMRVADKNGEHLLVMTRSVGASPSRPKSGRIEHIALIATYYDRRGTGWATAWTIRDSVDCPGLDAAAEFFTSAVSFTDLNADGRAEITVPYRLFCGGGIEPSIVKVILRDGATKLAIRGESTVQLPGRHPFGGEHQHDKVLLQPANAVFKRHLDQVWDKVSVDRRR